MTWGGTKLHPGLSSSPAPADVFLDEEDTGHGGDEQHGHHGQDDGGGTGGCRLRRKNPHPTPKLGTGDTDASVCPPPPPKHHRPRVGDTMSPQEPGKRSRADLGRTILPVRVMGSVAMGGRWPRTHGGGPVPTEVAPYPRRWPRAGVTVTYQLAGVEEIAGAFLLHVRLLPTGAFPSRTFIPGDFPVPGRWGR